ncbi:MAG: phosphoribosylformylglycinamidine synthase I [candidate division WOR-3 bacterium]
MVRVCVLFAAGTNCDAETAHAFEKAGARAETVHINRLKRRERTLDEFQILVIPGGFSYGDYIASGRVLANELKHNLKEDIERFIAAGKLILGICNGFQVLVKCGLLPAFERPFEPQSVTLDANDSGRYEDRWVYLRTEDSPCIFTRGLPRMVYLPVAHAEGKFIVKDQSVLTRLNLNRQVVFRYVDANGDLAEYPENPNGSIEGIAGICDRTGRVFGLMPHPERFIRIEHHPRWRRERLTKPGGIAIFENGVAYAQENL